MAYVRAPAASMPLQWTVRHGYGRRHEVEPTNLVSYVLILEIWLLDHIRDRGILEGQWHRLVFRLGKKIVQFQNGTISYGSSVS